MKILSIGDVHANPNIKCYLNENTINKFDKIILVGDYTDSFHDEYDNIQNSLIVLEYIINLKKEYPDKIILILGNHDLPYLFPPHVSSKNRFLWCTGHTVKKSNSFTPFYNDNIDLFQLSYQIENYIWTHAGINKTWLYDMFLPYIEKRYGIKESNINLYYSDTLSKIINESAFFNISEENPIYDVGHIRGGKRGTVGGPLWSDWREISEHPLDNFYQIFGHSYNCEGKIRSISSNENNKFVNIDCWSPRKMDEKYNFDNDTYIIEIDQE